MKSRLHELLKEIAGRGSISSAEIASVRSMAERTVNAGIIDLSKGLPSNVKFSVSAPSTKAEFFEDGALRFHELADEAVRKQVRTYVAGANILIAAINAGISGNPTALLNVVTQVVGLMDDLSPGD